MKKYFSLALILMLISCEKDQDQNITHVITSFNKQIVETIVPIKGKAYGAKFIIVKGYVDDTVFVSFGKKYYKNYLVGKIDTTYTMDYYGDDNASFIFNPYKAKKGNLKVTFSILGSK